MTANGVDVGDTDWTILSFWSPVGGMVGGCGARAVSRKTPIYFILGVKFLQLYDHFEIQMSLGRKYTAPLAGTLSYFF